MFRWCLSPGGDVVHFHSFHLQVQDPDMEKGYTCTAFHPDGLLFGELVVIFATFFFLSMVHFVKYPNCIFSLQLVCVSCVCVSLSLPVSPCLSCSLSLFLFLSVSLFLSKAPVPPTLWFVFSMWKLRRMSRFSRFCVNSFPALLFS